MIGATLAWLTDPAHWQGAEGVPAHLAEHLLYVALAVGVGALLGLPLGAAVGHTGRGVFLVAGAANLLRAIPTLGLMVLLVIVASQVVTGRSELGYLLPLEVVLVLLAVPPILSGTYAGIQAVPAPARDAAIGIGMTGWQLLWRVELPCALPLILGGVRAASLQCVATATIGAYISLGGLGRYVVDGLAQHDYPQMAAGAMLVAVLALILDGMLALAGRARVGAGRSG